ncbi:MAG TPA: TRAM domain-containing protein [Vicinamibacterales bacterium]|nr:TRAM domain-containing protein [Vicinamibacterales bacterium]
MLAEGQQVTLDIEKVAAGGWTIGRHHGQVVLVRGAIPGERVTAWIERADRRVAYAAVRDVLDASPDRRAPAFDPLCGGGVFAHVAYARQLALKGEIVQDAFTRLAHHPLERSPDVEGSPETGYRMRARLHVRGGRVGFYREGTHQLCDAAPTGQLRSETIDAAVRLVGSLQARSRDSIASIAIAENLAADQRAAHLESMDAGELDESALAAAAEDAGLTGLSFRTAAGSLQTAGDPAVSDSLEAISNRVKHPGEVRRHAESFFQGNRFLLPSLVSAVLDAVSAAGHVVDLYAGVGLFSLAIAAAGAAEVTAVEGDRSSARDLRHNARAFAPRLHAKAVSVEEFLSTAKHTPDACIVDPPRTGVSKPAMEAMLRRPAPRIVYVSCDPPTLARDARRLLDAGYALESIRAFDLFPNTAHVESFAVFGRPE